MNGVRLPALFLPYKEDKRHAFEVHLSDFVNDAPKGSVLILHAPTGAGKTHAVMKLTKRVEGVLLCLPTNALAAEVTEIYRTRFSDSVVRWTAEAFLDREVRAGIPRHQAMIEDARGKELIVSNPDLLHLFTQHEYASEGSRLRLSGFAMKNLDLVVFDEYHAYDERILASILLYIIKSRRARDNRQKFIFMSATPDEALKCSLEALNVEFCQPSADEPTEQELNGGEGRLIKGPIDVEVSAESIFHSLNCVSPTQRTLFIFSTFVDQQDAVRRLKHQGLPEEDTNDGFVQITGRKTRSERGQDTWKCARLLLATSKVEVGLNIENLDHVVMEPGWSEQSFWQRFGRAARGRPARVTLHFPGYAEEILAPVRNAHSYSQMTQAIHSLLRTKRQHVDTVLRFVGAYAACYHENTPPSVDRELVKPDMLPGPSRTGYGLVETMFRQWEKDETRNDPGGSGEWMRTVRLSLRGLRGRALRAWTIYEWSPDDKVDEDLLYVLSRTRWRRENDVYYVRDFRDTPVDVQLHYNLLDGAEAIVTAKRGVLRRDDFLQLPSRMKKIIIREFDNPPPFWKALISWLELVPPDEIPPREVTMDDIFL